MGSGTTANDAGADAVPLADGNATNTPLDATIDSSFARCPSGRGPDMVLVDDGKGTRFCIDSTEVTNAHYAAFLSTSPKTTGQPDVCGGNATYGPADTRSFDDIAQQQYPVAFVDLCDARAFCAWAGKRLCGHIGGGALQSDADRIDPAASQFMYVCTKGGTQLYSYGTTYRPGICNAGGGGAQPMVVGACGDCQGGFPGVFDLVGNVGEWTDDCANATEGGGIPVR